MEPEKPQRPARTAEDYRTLPEPVDLDTVIATHDADIPADPDAGRNPDQDFFMRYGFGI